MTQEVLAAQAPSEIAPISVRAASSWHRPLVIASTALAIGMVVTGIALFVDQRVLVGEPLWLKPFKFALSLSLYGFTQAWLLTMVRKPRLGWWMGNVYVVTALTEFVIIVAQAIRGQRSHFNSLTPFNQLLSQVMAATVGILWLSTLVVLVLLLKTRFADAPMARAFRAGLGLTAVGMVLGFLMSRPTPDQLEALKNKQPSYFGGHSVGAPDGGPSLPLIEWNSMAGDLRVPHFVGLHAIQVLVLLCAVLAIRGREGGILADARTRARLVAVAAVGYGGMIAVLTWQALRGQAFLSPDGATWTATGIVAAVVLVWTTIVLISATRRRA